MKKVLSSALFALFILGYCPQAIGQTATPEVNLSVQREAQILDNLKFLFPKLREVDIKMNALERSSLPNLDQGSITINGQQTQKFLVTSDNKQLFLLASGPVDVSRSREEVAAAMAEEEAISTQEAEERHVALLEAIANLPVRGNPDASVTIVEFSDFQCPYCAQAYNTVEALLAKYSQDVKFVYVNFPLPNHPWAKPASIASLCAAQQAPTSFWKLHDSYFEDQRQINPDNVLKKSKAYLTDTDIDLEVWSTCTEDTASAAYTSAALAVENGIAAGQRFGITGTPAFFVNGRFMSGAQPLEAFESLIAQAKQNIQ